MPEGLPPKTTKAYATKDEGDHQKKKSGPALGEGDAGPRCWGQCLSLTSWAKNKGH